MAIKVGIISLGCPKNEVDSQQILGYLEKDDRFVIVDEIKVADAVIINTCAFIETAKQESIDAIFEVADLKKDNLKCLIVTGCMAQRYKDEILQEIEEVDAVVGIGSFKKIASFISDAIDGKRGSSFEDRLNLDLNGYRHLINPNTSYAYLKIAEGCDNNCTYCAIPRIRGKYRSRKIEDIVNEAKTLLSFNVTELILVAQDTSYYGKDIYGSFSLYRLLEELGKLDFKWIRFLYCYPERINDRLIDTIKNSDKIVSYIDMPIQHINDEVLKRMNRKIGKKEIYGLIEKIRREIKDVVLRTSLIVGFPGETERQFNELLKFVKEVEFDRLGAFSYSREEGTSSYKLKGQIKSKVKAERVSRVMFEQQRVIEIKNNNIIGKTKEVIVDKKEQGIYIGRTKADAPEIDCNVFINSTKKVNIGDILNISITKSEFGDIYGKIIESEEKVK